MDRKAWRTFNMFSFVDEIHDNASFDVKIFMRKSCHMVFWFLEEVPSYREGFLNVTFTVITAPALLGLEICRSKTIHD